MAAPKLTCTLALVAVLACVSQTSSALTLNLTEVLYEVDGSGKVLINLFEKEPALTNLAPVIGDFNPSPRLDSCTTLGAGRFPVFGDCAKYLECIRTGSTFTRRIGQCANGLWYNHYIDDCELRQSEECTMGRLVPSSLLPESGNPIASRSGVAGSCTARGNFPLPGCRGYYTCTQTDAGFVRSEYICGADQLWDELIQRDFCVHASQISSCSVPLEEETCLRTCVAGERRTCRYRFAVHEFASMSSIYCGDCPTKLEDCNLPGCITAGGISKPLVAINRRMPGPTIQACRGDTLEIEVFNQLSSSAVTIHWHGLHQRLTPHMDGVPYLTQCPIHPGNSFRYRMEADIAGTHMYHSHIGHQESDGLFGAMIIREPRESELGMAGRYDVDNPEHRVLVWHWFKRAAETESMDTRMQSRRREGYGFLINGKGTVGRRFKVDGTPLPAPIETYQLTTGLRHRFRAIFNTALNCPMQLSIDGHRLDILAVDGRPISSHANGLSDSFIISAGERIDFVPVPTVATANNAYYMRIRGLNDCDDTKNGVHQHAILNYGTPGTVPLQSVPPPTYLNAIKNGQVFNLARSTSNPLTNTFLAARPLSTARDANTTLDARISGTPRRRFYMDASFNPFPETENVRLVAPQLNGISWSNPSFPLLTQVDMHTDRSFCSEGRGLPRGCETRQCSCPQMFEVDNGDLVEVVLADPRGFNDIGHPFHLHGFAFRVVAQLTFGSAQTMQQIRDLAEGSSITRNFNGPLKDTVLVPGRGMVIIRFVADNPGYWFFHCHISEHMAQGMALAFKVGSHAEMVRPPANFPRCGNFF